MKFVSFRRNGQVFSGVLSGTVVTAMVGDLRTYMAGGEGLEGAGDGCSVDEVELLPPLLDPPRIFGIGLNYRDHAAESQMKVQEVPTVFLKLPSSLCGHGADVLLPANATQPDYEAELAVVIGKGGANIAEADWQEHVFGYTIVNDVSARGVQLATTQWTLAKSFPTFTPMGPCIVTADEIPDPHALSIKLTLSGEVMQEAHTSDLIFRISALIAYISSIVPLLPGDVISTGTPAGVGLGRKPQRWLRDGDNMVIEIEKIGTLQNRTRTV
jgi:2-keto-4-pentenoate hydratase/2-oxohepta-3-ene-1,7-dioic acid hydratase in catechol pathway